MTIHASLVAYFGALALRHPESAELYRALPYIAEFCVLCWLVYTFCVCSVRDQFRLIADMTVHAPQPASTEVEPDADDNGIFQAPNGDWMQLTYDKRGRVNGSERCDPPKSDGPTVITPRGSFKLGRFS